MAIQKDKTLASGAAGNYWKIIHESVDKIGLIGTWVIALYFDKAHGDAKAPDLGLRKVYSASITGTDLQSGSITALGYVKIKAKAESLVPVFGDPDADPVPFDPDLVDGEDV